MDNRTIQRLLAYAKHYNGQIDGLIGPKSMKAVNTILDIASSALPEGWETWPTHRSAVAASQVVLASSDYGDIRHIDGFMGPVTLYALEEWEYTVAYGKRPPLGWRPDKDSSPRSLIWPAQSELEKFFGPAGGPQCTAGRVELPFPMVIAWDKSQTINHFSCHEKVANSAQRVYKKVASVYSESQIVDLGLNLFGGCYNYRKKRGGATLSTHAYGIAIDHDPERNQLRWKAPQANLSRVLAHEFWQCWKSEGWVGLGPERDFDWMHVQAATL